jgi:hypothetical protein
LSENKPPEPIRVKYRYGSTQLPHCVNCPNVLICPDEAIGIVWCAYCKRLSWVKNVFAKLTTVEEARLQKMDIYETGLAEPWAVVLEDLDPHGAISINVEWHLLNTYPSPRGSLVHYYELLGAEVCHYKNDGPKIYNSSGTWLANGTYIMPYDIRCEALVVRACSHCGEGFKEMFFGFNGIYKQLSSEGRAKMIKQAAYSCMTEENRSCRPQDYLCQPSIWYWPLKSGDDEEK